MKPAGVWVPFSLPRLSTLTVGTESFSPQNGAMLDESVRQEQQPAGGFMGKENEAFDLAQVAHKLTSHGPTHPPAALTWYTPVKFDPGLLKKLLDEHDMLDTRVASLPNRFRRDREEAWRVAHACAGQLHELRRQEALWIYPVIAHGLASDATARRQLMNLRFMMNSLARRVLRSIEELARTIRQVADINAAIATVTHALAEYRQRNETELYTLYSLMDPRRIPVAAVNGGLGLK